MTDDMLNDKGILIQLVTIIHRMSPEERLELFNDLAGKGLTDRRKHNRQAVDLSVSFNRMIQSGDGKIENLSAGGLFIRTHKDFKLGETIRMQFTLPSEENPLIATGKVIRKEVDGVGVEFDVSDFETGLISSLITLHSDY